MCADMRKAFTLIEMLVVIGIIAALMGASIVGYSRMFKSSEQANAQELVANVATAFTALFDADGLWPKTIRERGAKGGLLDENVGYVLAKRGYLSATYDDSQKKLTGADRFGVVSPWAAAVIKNLGSRASLSSVVSGSSKIQDHILYFAVDLTGEGVIRDISVGGESVSVRAPVMVWCGGKDGIIEPYSKGLKSDDVYSWSVGQTRNVK